MAGTILYNFWAALFGFTIYFFLSYPFDEPVPTLIKGFIWAVASFIVTFIFRAIFQYILFTPEKVEGLDEEKIDQDKAVLDNQTVNNKEFEPTTEEITKYVKSMLQADDEEDER